MRFFYFIQTPNNYVINRLQENNDFFLYTVTGYLFIKNHASFPMQKCIKLYCIKICILLFFKNVAASYGACRKYWSIILLPVCAHLFFQ